MDTELIKVRPTLQELESNYLTLEYEIRRYVLQSHPHLIEEVDHWLKQISCFSVGTRTVQLRVFIYFLTEEKERRENKEYLRNEEASLRKEIVSQQVVDQWIGFRKSVEQLKEGISQ